MNTNLDDLLERTLTYVARKEERENQRQCYSYTLESSLTGIVFYVGKGTGSRIHQHENEARRGCPCRKCQIIRQIQADGGHVVKRKVQEHLTDQEALDAERDLISSIGIENLTNFAPQSAIPQEESVIPVNICLYKAFRAEIEEPLKKRMEQEEVELSPASCYQYLQDICMDAIRKHLA